MKLLNIIASPRGDKSRTLQISNVFLNTLKLKYPELLIEDLNLFKISLPDIFKEAADAKYTILAGAELSAASEKVWREISEVAEHFLTADVYLISTPMWNFSVPYKLKHYIDVIMQPKLLFQFTATGVEGLAKNKKIFCISSRGNDYNTGSPMNDCHFQEDYLRSIFGLAGITDISFINAQPLDYAPEITAVMLDKASVEANLMAESCELNIAEPV